MSWPPASCCFQVVTSGITKWMGGRGGGGEGRGHANHQDVNITFSELYEFIFNFSPLKTVSHVVASRPCTLSHRCRNRSRS